MSNYFEVRQTFERLCSTPEAVIDTVLEENERVMKEPKRISEKPLLGRLIIIVETDLL